MEEPLCFVRDNPFVKADAGCRRLLRRAVAPAPPKPLRRVSPAATTAPSTEQRVEMGADSEGIQLSTSPSPDIEYGPGIVEKLKAKFSKLSNGVTKETRSRRSPSVDELNNHDYEPIRHMEAPMLVKRHSKSTNDIYEQEEPRTYTIHRVVAMDQDEDSIDAPCISTLRRKFETSADRAARLRPVSTDLSQVRDFSLHTSSLTYDAPPPRGLRLVEADPIVTTTTLRNQNVITSPLMSPVPVASPPLMSPVPVTVAAPVKETVVEPTRRLRVLEVLNQAESEPEFVKIGRRLRRSAAPPPDLFENNNSSEERRNVEFRTEIIEKPEVPAPDYEPLHYANEPAPFVRVERPLEAAPVMNTTVITTVIETPKAPPPRKFIIRGEAHLPTISGNFRVIRDTSSQSFELPPDPEPAKHSSSSFEAPPPVVHHYQPPPQMTAPQGSPPPEEPRPSKPTVEPEAITASQPCALCENSQPTPVVAKTETTPKNDGEGISEVQRLLSRFQMSRSNRGVFEVPQEEMRTFSSSTASSASTVVGMRSVDVTPAPPRPATGAGRVNVVSISVRSDAPSVITSLNSTDGVSPVSAPTPSKRMAPSPPEESLSPPVIETQPPLISQAPPLNQHIEEQRKSLSSQYLEEKARRERPYGDDVTELRTEPRESSVDEEPVVVLATPTSVAHYANEPAVAQPTKTTPVVQKTTPVAPPTFPIQDSESSASEDSESEENFFSLPTRPFTLSFSEPMFAGDGNPVRHTLLSLVMEEDIPMLMEAMQEKHNFIFEDLHERPSTSSIIHPLETRKLRRKQRQVSSIKFREEAPQVYTYLDEMTAEASQHWQEGALLDYDDYQRMLEVEQEELDQSLSELARWRQGVGRSWEEAQNGMIQSAVSSFNSLSDPNTISV